MTQQFYSLYVLKRVENMCSHKNFYMNVRSIAIRNRSEADTTKISPYGQNVVCEFNGILLSYKKE